MKLHRNRRGALAISVVSMIDVLMILLIFFMVTSTYLDLDMVPLAEAPDAAPSAVAGPEGRTLLIRLSSDGIAHVQGKPLTPAALEALLRARLAEDPAAPVVVLPSGAASTQALVAVMDAATRAGSIRLRILRLEARG